MQRLQSADERTKKRWVIILSAVAMVVIVFIWLKYFNTLVQPGGWDTPSAETEESFSFWQTMKAGLGVLYDKAAGGIQGLGNILQAPRDYLIKP